MMTTAEGGLAYQRWLATINQVCGHFAARPLEGRFHGEIDTRYAGNLKVSTVTAAGGTPLAFNAPDNAWAMAVLEWIASEPPRRITPLPAFRHRAAASAVTFGRAS